MGHPGGQSGVPRGETHMPQGSQRIQHDQTYGRPISESQPEEVLAETVQGQQRRAGEASGHRCQTSRRKKELTTGPRKSRFGQHPKPTERFRNVLASPASSGQRRECGVVGVPRCQQTGAAHGCFAPRFQRPVRNGRDRDGCDPDVDYRHEAAFVADAAHLGGQEFDDAQPARGQVARQRRMAMESELQDVRALTVIPALPLSLTPGLRR